jgi:chromate transporter
MATFCFMIQLYHVFDRKKHQYQNNGQLEFLLPANATTIEKFESAVSLREAAWIWARVAALSFGGPAGQIAVMHRILVQEKNWISESRFLHALNYCMLLPGPEAHELAIYIGWLLNRTRGGLIAGVLFVLPGLVSLGFLSWLYAAFGQIGIVQGLFLGMKAAVLALVLEAVMRVGKRTLKSPALVAIAALAFAGIFIFQLPFPLLIGAAALAGYAGNRFRLQAFNTVAGHETSGSGTPRLAVLDAMFARGVPLYLQPSFPRLLKIIVIGGALWLGPLLVLFLLVGPDNVFTSIAAFNSKMAVVSFGGAYAILAYMAQQAVEHYHWLQPSEMLVGLGFAETTPGPLISVVQFVGFMAGWRHPGIMSPALGGVLGGLLAMWSTFVPPFIWIFAGGPYIEALIGNKALHAALSAITAAVVGVILNLAIWFLLHTLFGQVAERHVLGISLSLPVLASVNWPIAVLALASVVAIFKFKIGMLPVLGGSALLGILYTSAVTP